MKKNGRKLPVRNMEKPFFYFISYYALGGTTVYLSTQPTIDNLNLVNSFKVLKFIFYQHNVAKSQKYAITGCHCHIVGLAVSIAKSSIFFTVKGQLLLSNNFYQIRSNIKIIILVKSYGRNSTSKPLCFRFCPKPTHCFLIANFHCAMFSKIFFTISSLSTAAKINRTTLCCKNLCIHKKVNTISSQRLAFPLQKLISPIAV